MAAAPLPPGITDDDLYPHLYVNGIRADRYYAARRSHSSGHRLALIAKRALDIVVSGSLLLLLAPLFLFCWAGVRRSSRGPFLFAQPRWGLGERQFQCFKMRSMYVPGDPDAPQHAHNMAHGDGTLLKMRGDPRVTRFGAWLRRTSIDELPQLLNVFRGDMSLVGPRPLVIPMLAPFDRVRSVRCVVRPGITGLWQIRNRHQNTHVSHMIAHDIEYIRTFSFWNDLAILLSTPREVLKGAGAH